MAKFETVCKLDIEKFELLMRKEAMQLVSTPFGGTLLYTVGQAYWDAVQSNTSSGGLDGIGRTLLQTGRSLGTRYSIASSTLRAAYSAREVQKMKSELEHPSPRVATAAAGGGAPSSEGATSASLKLKMDEMGAQVQAVM